MSEYMDNNLDLIAPINWATSNDVIKVIGVGGGGCNAVDYMYRQNVEGCSFIVCNTDAQALGACQVPTKIQLGEGLGAGTNPSIGRNKALETQDLIREKILKDNTQMLFITAGMGGGTGTGATPVIAKMAKDAGILTVGVVTLPFIFEGKEKLSKSIEGIHELEKNVDSLIVIKNENLYKVHGDKLIQDAFPKVNEVLSTAVSGIVEIIKKRGYINIDFKDIQNMMRDSGLALMGCGSGNGENRIADAVRNTFESPLLNDFDLKTAKHLLLNITVPFSQNGVTMKEQEEINKEISKYTGSANNFKYGLIFEDAPEFKDTIKITAIATGFKFVTLLGPEIDKSNIIIISKDDEDVPQASMEDEADDTIWSSHIGFNTTENKSKIKFNPEQKPTMLSDDENELRDLETIPAIRRIQK